MLFFLFLSSSFYLKGKAFKKKGQKNFNFEHNAFFKPYEVFTKFRGLFLFLLLPMIIDPLALFNLFSLKSFLLFTNQKFRNNKHGGTSCLRYMFGQLFTKAFCCNFF
jgi:hypothetical protein